MIKPIEKVCLIEGDLVGFGAAEPNKPDFFVFIVCKNIRSVNTLARF